MRRWTTWDWKREPEAPRAWTDPEERLVLVEPDFWAPNRLEHVNAHGHAWCAMQSSKAVFVVRTRHPDMVPRQTMKTVGGTVELVPAELAPNIVLAGHVHAQAQLDDARMMHLPPALLGSPSNPGSSQPRGPIAR